MLKATGKFIIAIIFISAYSAFAEDSVPLDISLIVSADSWKETELSTAESPYFRYRAIYHRSLYSEARPWLEVQKIRSDGVASELLWSKKIDAFSNDVTTKAVGEICGKDAPPDFDCEAKIGCCKMDSIRWDKLELSYKIYMRNVDIKGVRTFQCRADRLPYDDFTVVCAEEPE
ncbi:MAG: hypothetical protein JXR49_04900 [Acidobacteria bacterium]|nr:hypothetical protein [Acidobacteriota bacterium]